MSSPSGSCSEVRQCNILSVKLMKRNRNSRKKKKQWLLARGAWQVQRKAMFGLCREDRQEFGVKEDVEEPAPQGGIPGTKCYIRIGNSSSPELLPWKCPCVWCSEGARGPTACLWEPRMLRLSPASEPRKPCHRNRAAGLLSQAGCCLLGALLGEVLVGEL